MNTDKLILDLCGGLGSWGEPYRMAGYKVLTVDILYGYGLDVRLFKKPKRKVHGILAAPPCTHFSLSGARWWKEKGDTKLIESLSVVDACLRIIWVCKPKWWALENPVGRLTHYLGKPRMYFNPSDYGDGYTKKTCLWGNFNPPGKWFPVKPTKPLKGHHSMDIHLKVTSQQDRSKLRSITPPGFAKAFFEANR